MLIPNCTLTTACFCVHKDNNGTRNLNTVIQNSYALLKVPIYLVIYGDNLTIPLMREKRIEYGLENLTHFVETTTDELWSFQYSDKVKQNRELYYPSRDVRSSVETHLIQSYKFTFVLNTIQSNPFNTTQFGWIDCFGGKEKIRFCENYEPNIIPHILSNISDKFHIQILNVCDKKFKLDENKHEYYSKYQYVVCGGFFTCGADIGVPILNRLNEIFVNTTELGYGHGEEMLFLEVLDEFYDDIERSYGDYGQILNNFITPTKNLHYIYYLILKNYIRLNYWREAYDCTSSLLKSIEKYNISENYEIIVGIVLDHFISATHYNPSQCKKIYDKITTEYLKNPLFLIEYQKNKYITDNYFTNLETISN